MLAVQLGAEKMGEMIEMSKWERAGRIKQAFNRWRGNKGQRKDKSGVARVIAKWIINHNPLRLISKGFLKWKKVYQ